MGHFLLFFFCPTYQEIRLTGTFAKWDTYSMSRGSPTYRECTVYIKLHNFCFIIAFKVCIFISQIFFLSVVMMYYRIKKKTLRSCQEHFRYGQLPQGWLVPKLTENPKIQKKTIQITKMYKSIFLSCIKSMDSKSIK